MNEQKKQVEYVWVEGESKLKKKKKGRKKSVKNY